MSTANQATVRYSGRIAPSLDELVTVRDALTEALREASWSDEDAFRVLVCADEAMANALTHGDGGEPIDVRFHVAPALARVAVRDRHAACELPAAEHIPDTTAEHGRGLVLMRALADRFRVRPSRYGTSVGLTFRPAAVTS